MTTSPTGPRLVPGTGRVAQPHFRRVLLIAAAVLFFVVFVIPWLAGFATDWLWFHEIHFESVYLTSLITRAVLFVGGACFAFAFVYLNVRGARRGFAVMRTLFVSRAGAAVPVDFTSFVPRLLLGVALVAAFATAMFASSQWMSVLMALHGVRVGQVDPMLGRDIGFYLFRLPAVSAALGTLVALTLLSLAAVIVLYLLGGAIVPRRRG